MSYWKVILAALVIFAAGLFTGGFVVTLSHRNDAPVTVRPKTAGEPVLGLFRRDLVRRMDTELRLTPDQRERIGRILRESHERTQPLRKRIEPEMKEEQRRVKEEMRAVLRPDQLARFEELFKPTPARAPGDSIRPWQQRPDREGGAVNGSRPRVPTLPGAPATNQQPAHTVPPVPSSSGNPPAP